MTTGGEQAASVRLRYPVIAALRDQHRAPDPMLTAAGIGPSTCADRDARIPLVRIFGFMAMVDERNGAKGLGFDAARHGTARHNDL